MAGDSVPVLDFGAKCDLNGARGYVGGIWASSPAYRPSNRTFYRLGQNDLVRTYIYTATAVAVLWNRLTTISAPRYDVGLLVDSDDTLYVADGNTTISVAQLSSDGGTQVRTHQVFTTPSGCARAPAQEATRGRPCAHGPLRTAPHRQSGQPLTGPTGTVHSRMRKSP